MLLSVNWYEVHYRTIKSPWLSVRCSLWKFGHLRLGRFVRDAGLKRGEDGGMSHLLAPTVAVSVTVCVRSHLDIGLGINVSRRLGISERSLGSGDVLVK